MNASCTDCGGAVLITIDASKFDATNAWQIRADLREFLRDDRDVYLFDMSKVGFLDSAGIGTMIGFVKFAGRTRRVELTGLSPAVTKTLRQANLMGFFTIHDSVEDGLLSHRTMRSAVNG